MKKPSNPVGEADQLVNYWESHNERAEKSNNKHEDDHTHHHKSVPSSSRHPHKQKHKQIMQSIHSIDKSFNLPSSGIPHHYEESEKVTASVSSKQFRKIKKSGSERLENSSKSKEIFQESCPTVASSKACLHSSMDWKNENFLNGQNNPTSSFLFNENDSSSIALKQVNSQVSQKKQYNDSDLRKFSITSSDEIIKSKGQSINSQSSLETQQIHKYSENCIPARYILACNGNKEEAKKRWIATIEWRASNNIDNLINKPQPYFMAIKLHYPHYFHTLSQTGDYLYIERPGKANFKTLLSTGKAEQNYLSIGSLCE